MRCKPDELCMVIAEDPGCESNIGAMVMVRSVEDDRGRPAWVFDSASRPLLWYFRDGRYRVTSTEQLGGRPRMPDAYLLPIRWPDGEKPISAAEWRQVNEEATA